MTDNKRYSLSSASEKILSELKSPILIRVYLSNALTKENALYAGYAPYVLRFLKKYQQAAAKDKIKIEIINPEPYSPQEEEAKTAGLKPLADSSGQTSLYFGAVFREMDSKIMSFPILSLPVAVIWKTTSPASLPSSTRKNTQPLV